MTHVALTAALQTKKKPDSNEKYDCPKNGLTSPGADKNITKLKADQNAPADSKDRTGCANGQPRSLVSNAEQASADSRQYIDSGSRPSSKQTFTDTTEK